MPEVGSPPKASCKTEGCPRAFEPINEKETHGLCKKCLKKQKVI